MTVRKVESKIARSFDAWAQWQLRTPYCDPFVKNPVLQAAVCIKRSGTAMPSNCGPYGIK